MPRKHILLLIFTARFQFLEQVAWKAQLLAHHTLDTWDEYCASVYYVTIIITAATIIQSCLLWQAFSLKGAFIIYIYLNNIIYHILFEISLKDSHFSFIIYKIILLVLLRWVMTAIRPVNKYLHKIPKQVLAGYHRGRVKFSLSLGR